MKEIFRFIFIGFTFRSHKKGDFFYFSEFQFLRKGNISKNNVKHVGIQNSVVRYFPVVGAKAGVVANGPLNLHIHTEYGKKQDRFLFLLSI